jgi:hypothetical protein
MEESRDERLKLAEGWRVGDEIENLDQQRLTRAVAKRLRRGLREAPSTDAQMALALVERRMREWKDARRPDAK